MRKSRQGSRSNNLEASYIRMDERDRLARTENKMDEMEVNMLPKYTVEYLTPFKNCSMTSHYSSDDPVACEEFVEELLERNLKIKAIKHEGLDVPKPDFDKMVRTAASMMTSRHLCASLGIKPEEERYRFGFSA